MELQSREKRFLTVATQMLNPLAHHLITATDFVSRVHIYTSFMFNKFENFPVSHGVLGGRGYFYIFTLLHVSEHSEHFCFWLFLWLEKINYFHGWGLPPPPFAENSAKIINLIFEPFPNVHLTKLEFAV